MKFPCPIALSKTPCKSQTTGGITGPKYVGTARSPSSILLESSTGPSTAWGSTSFVRSMMTRTGLRRQTQWLYSFRWTCRRRHSVSAAAHYPRHRVSEHHADFVRDRNAVADISAGEPLGIYASPRLDSPPLRQAWPRVPVRNNEPHPNRTAFKPLWPVPPHWFHHLQPFLIPMI